MPLILLEHQGPVAVVRLNRPERNNSLVPEMLGEMLDVVQEVSESEAGVMLLTAEGPHFSTGGDVLGFWEHRNDPVPYATEVVGLLNEVILSMVRCPQPIVVAVQGMVTGGSLGLVLAGDLVVVSKQASIRPWYGTVGFSPDGGWTAMLPSVIGAQRAAATLFTDATITPAQAVSWGIAVEAVPADEVRVVAMRYASQIADQAAGATRHAKRLLAGDVPALAARLETEREHFIAQIVTEEAIAGMARFLGEA